MTKGVPIAPISVTMIVRNEEAGLEEALQSIRPYVEEVVIVDTGSTDRTPEIAKKYADVVKTSTTCNNDKGEIISFAQARNEALRLAKKQWVMWLDGDDVVIGAEHLRDLVNQTRNKMGKHVNAARISMIYALPGGMVNTRERIVCPPNHFEWQGAVHECLVAKEIVHDPRSTRKPYQGQSTILDVMAPDSIVIEHQPKKEKMLSKEPARNLRILKHELATKGHLIPREMFYLGREYRDNGEPARSIDWLSRYVQFSIFPEEKTSAHVMLSELHLMRLDHQAAILHALLGHATCETLPDPLVQISKCFYLLGNCGEDRWNNFRRCVHFARQALDASKKPHERRLFVHPDRIGMEVHRYLNFALHWMGDVSGALESVDTALAYVPKDAPLLSNRSFYLTKLERWEEALSSIEAALTERPTEKEYIDRRKLCLDKLGRSSDDSKAANTAAEE